MRIGRVTVIPRLSNHGSEVFLLWFMAMGIIGLLWRAIEKGIVGSADAHGFDVAAFLLILQRVVEAVQKRWEQRGQDAQALALAHSTPIPTGGPDGTPDRPVHTFEENPEAGGSNGGRSE